uniref:Uncharacterized protein n=1 Tax=Oryza meridionalis TaxID=40149 RepID=A0A0E0DVN6_9ORYZ
MQTSTISISTNKNIKIGIVACNAITMVVSSSSTDKGVHGSSLPDDGSRPRQAATLPFALVAKPSAIGAYQC